MKKREKYSLIAISILSLLFIVTGFIFKKEPFKIMTVALIYMIATTICFMYGKLIRKEFLTTFLVLIIIFGLQIFMLSKGVNISKFLLRLIVIIVSLLFIGNYIVSLLNFIKRKKSTARIIAFCLYTLYHLLISYIFLVYIFFIFLI